MLRMLRSEELCTQKCTRRAPRRTTFIFKRKRHRSNSSIRIHLFLKVLETVVLLTTIWKSHVLQLAIESHKNRVSVSFKNLIKILLCKGRIRATVATAPNPSMTFTEGGGINGQRIKKLTHNNIIGRGLGGWPKEDPLHDPPMQIEFKSPQIASDQKLIGAKTSFHTHQHSLIGMESRGFEDDIAISNSLKDHGSGTHISQSHFISR